MVIPKQKFIGSIHLKTEFKGFLSYENESRASEKFFDKNPERL
jgi:hypothetical protein